MTGSTKKGRGPLLGAVATELIDQLQQVQSAAQWRRWRRTHESTLAAVYRLLPDCRELRRLTTVGRAKRSRFGGEAAHAG